MGAVIEGIYRIFVSGSRAAPHQFAPPPQPGSVIVPFSVGGVKSGP